MKEEVRILKLVAVVCAEVQQVLEVPAACSVGNQQVLFL